MEGQTDLVEGVSAYGRRIKNRSSLGVFQSKPFYGFVILTAPKQQKATGTPKGSQTRGDSEKKVWFMCGYANKCIRWKYLMKTTELLIAAGLAQ